MSAIRMEKCNFSAPNRDSRRTYGVSRQLNVYSVDSINNTFLYC